MVCSDELRGLMAGPVFAAGRVKGATIRTWIAKHGLILGDREKRVDGLPRYDLADCARLLLLNIFVDHLKMKSAPAVWATNAAWRHIAQITDHELAAIDTGNAPNCPRWELSFSAYSLGVETTPDIRLYDDPEAIADRENGRGKICRVSVDLRELVRSARDNLAAELGHSLSGLRHDFADAVES